MISNASKNTVIARNSKTCSFFWQKIRGLMFRSRIIPLIFPFRRERKIRLHSFFVRHPFDIVLIDKNSVVVELSRGFKKRFFTSKKKAKTVLELPDGSIESSRTEIGDSITFK